MVSTCSCIHVVGFILPDHYLREQAVQACNQLAKGPAVLSPFQGTKQWG